MNLNISLTGKSLSKIYKLPGQNLRSRTVVKNVSLTLTAGCAVGLAGASGSGKSTLAKMLAHLIPPDKGEVLLNNKRIDHLSERQIRSLRHNFTYIAQNAYSALDPTWRISSLFYPIIKNSYPKHNNSQLRKIALTSLNEVGLPADSLTRYPDQFSGGQLQRICLARALLSRAKLIIADEITSGLDTTNQYSIVQLLARLIKTKGVGCLFISHNLGIINLLCSEILVMNDGIIVEQGQTDKIFTNPQHQYTKELLNAIPKFPY